MAIIPRGVVQKIVIEPSPSTLWLKHNPALFVEDEWVWTELERDAFIFDTYEKAQDVRKLLMENGEDGWMVAMVHQERKVAVPEENEVIRVMPTLPHARKHTSPTETFEVLEKRGLA